MNKHNYETNCHSTDPPPLQLIFMKCYHFGVLEGQVNSWTKLKNVLKIKEKSIENDWIWNNLCNGLEGTATIEN